MAGLFISCTFAGRESVDMGKTLFSVPWKDESCKECRDSGQLEAWKEEKPVKE